jgi:hypothetical protein
MNKKRDMDINMNMEITAAMDMNIDTVAEIRRL